MYALHIDLQQHVHAHTHTPATTCACTHTHAHRRLKHTYETYMHPNTFQNTCACTHLKHIYAHRHFKQHACACVWAHTHTHTLTYTHTPTTPPYRPILFKNNINSNSSTGTVIVHHFLWLPEVHQLISGPGRHFISRALHTWDQAI